MFEMHFSLASEPNFSWKLIFEILPHLLWASVIVFLFTWLGRGNVLATLMRIDKVGIGGLEVEFRKDLDAAVASRETPVSNNDRARVTRRLAASSALVQDAQILWVDDHPRGNSNEAKLFQDAGARITWAASTREAVLIASRVAFDVAISDIGRIDKADTGLQTAVELAKLKIPLDVVFYVSKVDAAKPKDAFGIADQPDQLIHLVLDVLARQRS